MSQFQPLSQDSSLRLERWPPPARRRSSRYEREEMLREEMLRGSASRPMGLAEGAPIPRRSGAPTPAPASRRMVNSFGVSLSWHLGWASTRRPRRNVPRGEHPLPAPLLPHRSVPVRRPALPHSAPPPSISGPIAPDCSNGLRSTRVCRSSASPSGRSSRRASGSARTDGRSRAGSERQGARTPENHP